MKQDTKAGDEGVDGICWLGVL